MGLGQRTRIVSLDRRRSGAVPAGLEEWFGDEGGARNGGPEDPRLALILVDVQSVTYLKQDKPRPVILFELVKGLVTGSRGGPRALSGEVRQVDEAELTSVAALPGPVADRAVEPADERHQRREIALEQGGQPGAGGLLLGQRPGRGERLVSQPPLGRVAVGVASGKSA